MINQIYPHELQLNKANTSDTETPFLDSHLSISNGSVSSKSFDERVDFDFDIVNFPFFRLAMFNVVPLMECIFLNLPLPLGAWDGIRYFIVALPEPSINYFIIFARVCSHVEDLNARNKCLTAKLIKQGYRYHKLRKAFSKFYRRHYELISKFNVGLKSLLHQGLSEPEF